MKSAEINSKLIDSYISLLKNMSAQNKLDLILKLANTVKTDMERENTDFYKAFGDWDKTECAEGVIETIKESRTFNRTIEKFWINTRLIQTYAFIPISYSLAYQITGATCEERKPKPKYDPTLKKF